MQVHFPTTFPSVYLFKKCIICTKETTFQCLCYSPHHPSKLFVEKEEEKNRKVMISIIMRRGIIQRGNNGRKGVARREQAMSCHGSSSSKREKENKTSYCLFLKWQKGFWERRGLHEGGIHYPLSTQQRSNPLLFFSYVHFPVPSPFFLISYITIHHSN